MHSYGYILLMCILSPVAIGAVVGIIRGRMADRNTDLLSAPAVERPRLRVVPPACA